MKRLGPASLLALLLGYFWSTGAVAHTKSVSDGLPLALHSAVTLHPSVSAKLAELKALGFDLAAARAGRYPLLGVQASATDNVAGSTSSTAVDRSDTIVAVLKQPLWTGGRIDGAIDRAEIKQQTGALAVFALQRQLMEETAGTYATILGARQRLLAAKDNVHEHQQLQALITRRQDGGIASEADIQLAASRVSQAVAQQQQLEAALHRSINDLHALTQLAITAELNVPEEFAQLPRIEQIPVAAEEASALIRQRQMEVEQARTEAQLAKADMMPSLYAKVEQDVLASTSDRDNELGTRVGLVLEGNLDGLGFTGLKKMRSAETRITAARRQVDAVRNDEQRTINGLLTDLNSYQAILQSNEQLVRSTRQTLDSFLRQYDAGRKSWLDVLNTLRDLASARLEMEQSRSALLATKLRLATRLGRLDAIAEVTL